MSRQIITHRGPISTAIRSRAAGHPFAATGARIVATMAKQLAERGGGRGLISICTAGGMGVAAILEGNKAAEVRKAA